MAFAIAGLARGNVTIAKDQVVSKSYPRFWKDFASLTGTPLSPEPVDGAPSVQCLEGSFAVYAAQDRL
jgi:hypothetical protein